MIIAFIILKCLGIITISWLWAIPAVLLGNVPLANTAVFVVFKTADLFTAPASWWWLILTVALDIAVFIGYILQYGAIQRKRELIEKKK